MKPKMIHAMIPMRASFAREGRAAGAKALATTDSAKALRNADSFEYYIEGVP